MEDTLRGRLKQPYLELGLNPCFNGRYSQSDASFAVNHFTTVLILVLMEDTLRGMDY